MTKSHFVPATYFALVVMSVVLFGGPTFASAQTATSTAATTTRIQELLARITELTKQLQTLRGEVQQLLMTDAGEGSQSDDVRKVQELLATDPEIYPEGRVTGYFGPLTRQAIERFQIRNGLPVTGVLDEKTRDVLKEFLKERQQGQVPPGLLRSQEVRERVRLRLEEKWDMRCDLSLQNPGARCKLHDNDTDEEDDETVGDVSRTKVQKEIVAAQREINRSRLKITDRTDKGDYSADDAAMATRRVDEAATLLSTARQALVAGELVTAYKTAKEARKIAGDFGKEIQTDEGEDDDNGDDGEEDEDEDEDDEGGDDDDEDDD